MAEYIIESQFVHEGKPCAILLSKRGYRCGYVGVPKTSPLYAIGYGVDLKDIGLDIDMSTVQIGKKSIVSCLCWDGKSQRLDLICDVHGGITYADGCPDYPVKTKHPTWWFGFDCAHAGDARDWDAVKRNFLLKDYIREYSSDLQMKGMYPYEVEKIRSFDYVRKECENLSEQLSDIEKLLKKEGEND